MKQFAADGIAASEVKQLKELIAVKAPFLNQLLDYLLTRCQQISNRQESESDWEELLLATSPVCAMIHPGDELHEVLTKVADGKSDLDICTLQFLQKQCPLIFDILQRVKPLPRHDQMFPVIYELLKKGNAPFNIPKNQTGDLNRANNDASYFPALPIVHGRGSYVADTLKRSKICTKKAPHTPHSCLGSLRSSVTMVWCSRAYK